MFAYCPTGVQWYKDRDQWQDNSYTPRTGDIIFFDWEADGECDHVGIVESVENGYVNTIEGNTSDSVARRSYELGSVKIYTAEVLEYESEVIKIIRGESKLNPDLLNKLHEDAKTRATDAAQVVKALEAKVRDGEKMRESLSQQFDSLQTWADMYDGCDLETKKMIVSRIMHSVRVGRDYEIEIDLTVDCEQMGIKMDCADTSNKRSA